MKMKREIKKYLYPLQMKMGLETFIWTLTMNLLLAGLLILFILLYSKLFPFPKYALIIEKILLIAPIAFLISFACFAPRFGKVLKTADSLCFKERLLTALEFESEESLAIKLQREETLKKMSSVKLSPLYKIKLNKKLAYGFCAVLVLIMAVNFIETNVGIKNKIASQTIKEIKKETESLKKNLQKELEQSNVTQETADKLIKELEKNLKGIENKEDALKALSITKNELAKELSKEELEKIQSALKKIDESAKELAEKTISDHAFNSEKEDSLKESREDSEQQNPSDSRQQDSDTSNGEGNDKVKEGGESSNSNSSGEGNNSDSNNSNEDQKNPEGENKNDEKNSPSDSENQQKDGNSEKQGESEQPGSSKKEANENSQGEEASGASGNDSPESQNGNTSQGKSPSQKSGKEGKGAAIGAPGSNDIMIDPKRINTKENNKFVPSQIANENDDSSYRKAKNRPKEAGEIKDYEKIIAEYAKEAGFTSNELNIPNGMRNVVKSYFDSIQK